MNYSVQGLPDIEKVVVLRFVPDASCDISSISNRFDIIYLFHCNTLILCTGPQFFWPFVLWFVAVCLTTSCPLLSRRRSCILNKSHSIIPCSSCTPRAPQAPPNVWSILWGWVLTVYWRCWLKEALYTEFKARFFLEWGLHSNLLWVIKCIQTSPFEIQKSDIVEKWDWDQKLAHSSFMTQYYLLIYRMYNQCTNTVALMLFWWKVKFTCTFDLITLGVCKKTPFWSY